ncbi:SUZ domain-containing protein 1 isoform X2 [Varanus komodoensis]|uniref:SUZ domain-containing protein 1 isoform X2 n=1 Tax=Varanus komodoensis TaxID=61221 RepID=UPI001CF7E3A1|nr:SUZ domain-containing protein 1 isoform X2 [Varanus komodoensis]
MVTKHEGRRARQRRVSERGDLVSLFFGLGEGCQRTRRAPALTQLPPCWCQGPCSRAQASWRLHPIPCGARSRRHRGLSALAVVGPGMPCSKEQGAIFSSPLPRQQEIQVPPQSADRDSGRQPSLRAPSADPDLKAAYEQRGAQQPQRSQPAGLPREVAGPAGGGVRGGQEAHPGQRQPRGGARQAHPRQAHEDLPAGGGPPTQQCDPAAARPGWLAGLQAAQIGLAVGADRRTHAGGRPGRHAL